MLLVLAVMGLFLGSLLNWAGDYLPRFASNRAAFPSAARPASAVWQRLMSFASRPSHPRLPMSSWLNVAVELATAALLAYLGQRFGWSWKLLYLAVACSFFLLIAIIDLKYRLVLNVLVYPAAALALLLHSVPPGRDTLTALLGGAVGLSPFLLAAWLKPDGMGSGDVKLAALIGLWVGFPHVLWALSLGILAGAATALVLLLTRRWSLTRHIPYAPFLCLGTVLSLLGVPFFFILRI
jgi:prepilin signal peptidase PulO-like enzyme (type II secretory pathway)